MVGWEGLHDPFSQGEENKVLTIGARHTNRMRMNVCVCARARTSVHVCVCVCNTCACVQAPSAEGGKDSGNTVCRGLVTGEDAAC